MIFNEKDLEALDDPYNDALVITLIAGGFKFQQILVINYMRLWVGDIKGASTLIVGFKANVTRAVGRICLHMSSYPYFHVIEFHVIDSPLPKHYHGAILDS